MGDELNIISREEWGARPPQGEVYKFSGPVSQVFIHTSVTRQLDKDATRSEEAAQMRAVQQIAFSRGFSDFSYSWGVFPSGRVYKGRGRHKVQAATEGYNSTSYSICTIGNTDAFKPTDDQVDSIVKLINHLQSKGLVAKTVNVRGHREVAPKACPGAKFTDSLIAEIQRRVNR